MGQSKLKYCKHFVCQITGKKFERFSYFIKLRSLSSSRTEPSHRMPGTKLRYFIAILWLYKVHRGEQWNEFLNFPPVLKN